MPGRSAHGARALAILGALAICALAPALADARITVPPGATEGDQYFEEVQDGGGSGSVNPGGEGGSGPPVAGTDSLNALGPEGQAAAALANANRPAQGAAARTEQGPPSSSTAGEGGMGALFVILLVVSALAAIAYGLRDRLKPA